MELWGGGVDPGAVSAVVQQTLPALVAPLLPIPTYRISVLGSALLVLGGPVAGVLIDRPATLATFAFVVESLGGISAQLTLKLTKNGVDIPGTTIPITNTTLTQTFAIPGSVAVVAGDKLRVVVSGVSVGLSAGDLFGYIKTV